MTGLWLRKTMPEAASLFTTHATSIGRSICGNGKNLYEYFSGYNGDQMARELNMEAKHSVEKAAAINADCFTAVSTLTADECAQLLDKRPDVVTPNGFEPDFVPAKRTYNVLRNAVDIGEFQARHKYLFHVQQGYIPFPDTNKLSNVKYTRATA